MPTPDEYTTLITAAAERGDTERVQALSAELAAASAPASESTPAGPEEPTVSASDHLAAMTIDDQVALMERDLVAYQTLLRTAASEDA